MRLPDRSIQQIAKLVGTSGQVVMRLLGDVQVGWSELCSETNMPKTQNYRLGLRLQALSALELSRVVGKEEVVASALSEYRNCCPLVSKWIWSGGFNPKKLPDELDKAKLVHSCRTAGRLRARVLRDVRCG